jgi:hypothetical protein
MAANIILPIISASYLCNRCGAPKFLLNIDTSVTSNILDNVDEILIKNNSGGILRRISVERQLNMLERTLHNTTESPYIYTITSKVYQRRSQLMAALILSQSGDGSLWHVLTGSFKDDLRDKYNDRINLLVIDGLNVDSSNIKFEKCYDLLEMYADIPRILVSSGCNPLELMAKIHIQANRVLYLDDPPAPTPEM